MNDAMSLGVHRIWKNFFIDQIGPIRKRTIIDEKGNFSD
jgi:ubiquinone/menaquinone biosynthesis C-methylase UbiE